MARHRHIWRAGARARGEFSLDGARANDRIADNDDDTLFVSVVGHDTALTDANISIVYELCE